MLRTVCRYDILYISYGTFQSYRYNLVIYSLTVAPAPSGG